MAGAADMISRRGLSATSVRELAAHAGTPWAGWPVARLCQMAAVSARRRLGDAGADSFDAAPAVQLEIELAFEGVVDRLDELAYRLE